MKQLLKILGPCKMAEYSDLTNEMEQAKESFLGDNVYIPTSDDWG